ncbi:hypothetical protein AOQ84DRAFT_368810 [Glonium stellatum]|uniref:Heterokaryon incompatibility domain-containing protein n=1 Tax=Glonium stellatum TaxID=574774 RepID=A0A8E2EQH9_9PEZI|nr:hypothetical protein AOQ84DRAFT_368810 [Glonium stellatum]
MESRRHEIETTDKIYASAEPTIVVASDISGTSGIPGVQRERQETQCREFLDGTEIVEILPNLSQSVDKTLWNKRAWTYQGRLLSKRCLYFTEDQVIFRSQRDILYEDILVAKHTLALEKLWGPPTTSKYAIGSNDLEHYYWTRISFLAI